MTTAGSSARRRGSTPDARRSGYPGWAARYPKLRGSRVDRHLDGPHRTALAAQLGEFLGELHRFPVSRVIELGVRAYDPAGWFEQLRLFYADARARVFP